ncbi:hypothetical protein BDR26DRAFT_778555, partial [Obelidium mucronatum]
NLHLQKLLRTSSSHLQNEWDTNIAAIEFAYNSMISEESKLSRFEVELGYQPKSPTHITTDNHSIKLREHSTLLNHLKSIDLLVKDLATEAATAMKVQFNNKHKHIEFNVNDLVKINSKDIPGHQNKITHRFIRPYKVIQ